MQLTASEERLILEQRAKEMRQQQRNANALKLLEISLEYARHCRETGEYPSYSDYNNLYNGKSASNPLVYKQVLQIIKLSKDDAPDFDTFL